MQALKDIVTKVVSDLSNPERTIRTKLIQEWNSIAGPKIAPHTKPSLSREGTLYVWTDDSTLAYELNQRYRQALLKRTQSALGEEAVKKIYFRVGQLR